MHYILEIIFGIKLHVSDSSSFHHQEFFTVHTATVYVIQVCWQIASRIRTETVPSWSCSQWHVPLLCLQWKTPDDGQRNCPKHAEFYSKNKFEKLVHLVGFITPWCRVLLEQLTGLKLVKNFPAFHGNRRFITALKSFRYLSLSWASPIQSI